MGKKKLSKTKVNVHDVFLSSEDLRQLFKDLKYSADDLDKLKEKNNFNWAYVKARFKNEIDISKNFPVQSLAAHITNLSMLQVTRLFKEKGLKESRVFSVIHDELSCYADESEVEKSSEMLQLGMEDNEFSKLLDIPMEAIPVIANTLREAK